MPLTSSLPNGVLFPVGFRIIFEIMFAGVLPDDQGVVDDPMDLDEGTPSSNLNESDLAWYASYYGQNDPGSVINKTTIPPANNDTTISPGDPMDISKTPSSDQVPRRSLENSRLRISSLSRAVRPVVQNFRGDVTAPIRDILRGPIAQPLRLDSSVSRPQLGPITNRYVPYHVSPPGQMALRSNRLDEARRRLHGGVVGRGGTLFSSRTHRRVHDPFSHFPLSSFEPLSRQRLVIDRSDLAKRRRRLFGYDPDRMRAPSSNLPAPPGTPGNRAQHPGSVALSAGTNAHQNDTNTSQNYNSAPGGHSGQASQTSTPGSTVPLKRTSPDSDPHDIPGGFPESPDSPTAIRKIAAKRFRTSADSSTQSSNLAQTVIPTTPAKATQRGFRMPSPTSYPSPAKPQDDTAASTQGASPPDPAQADEDTRSPGSTSWISQIERVLSGPRQTTMAIVQSAITMAQAAKRRALALFEGRRIPRISRPMPNWQRLNIRALPEEVQRRIRDRRWRRDRAQPAHDAVLPFPELNVNVDQPQATAPETSVNPPATAVVNGDRPVGAVSPAARRRWIDPRFVPAPGSGYCLRTDEEHQEYMERAIAQVERAKERFARECPDLVYKPPTGRRLRSMDEPHSMPRTRAVTPALTRSGLPVAEHEHSIERPVEQLPEQPVEHHERATEHPDEHVESEYASFRPPSPRILGTEVSAVSLVRPNPVGIPLNRTPSRYLAEHTQMEQDNASRERKAKQPRVHLEGTAIRPISEEWEAKLDDAMHRSHARHIATSLSGDPLTRKDLATCFTAASWLNDEIINCYLAMIVEYLRRANGNTGRHVDPRFHAFNTFFFSNLRDKGYQSVRRWASRAKVGGANLLDVDTIFVPVHNSSHWTLIVIKPSERTIENFDSLGSLSRKHIKLIKGWLKAELGAKYIDKEWKVPSSKSPQQDNGSDCGVFLLSTAKAVALNINPLSYGASDIRLLRKKIVAEIINGGLQGAFDPFGDEGDRM